MIKTVSIIGMGALGILYGSHLLNHMPKKDLRIIADKDRIIRYQRDHIFCNGECCKFNYMSPEETCEPADLLIFSVKYNGLDEAIEAVKNQVGPNTIILSLLNGISSEAIIAKTFGEDKILYCVAQGMDAVRVGNHLTYEHMGTLIFGDRNKGEITPRTKSVAEFFTSMDVPYQIDSNMAKRMWGKFMLNVGVNQTAAAYVCNYGGIQKDGPERKIMISAMREVVTLSKKAGIDLTEDDINYWLNVISPLNPDGKPSMQQDIEAKRHTEVELFAGTVLKMGAEYGLETPTNRDLYNKILETESKY